VEESYPLHNVGACARGAKLPIIYPDIRLDYKLATPPLIYVENPHLRVMQLSPFRHISGDGTRPTPVLLKALTPLEVLVLLRLVSSPAAGKRQ